MISKEEMAKKVDRLLSFLASHFDGKPTADVLVYYGNNIPTIFTALRKEIEENLTARTGRKIYFHFYPPTLKHPDGTLSVGRSVHAEELPIARPHKKKRTIPVGGRA